eukprot:TRINITY_DN8236_c0_g1_i3.p2 TRINITY_DN8236_c0_g1~~TRINITY_DN8236_c0_g1_i3.p2  ORF type:complete len:118 (+),score=18.83 TRINITY_DN8236_c0_g1_i3:662-1015(+)
MGFFVPSDVKWSENLLEEEINFLCSLPYTVSVPQFGVIVVHAGLIPGIPLDQQHRSVMYKIRNLVVVKDEVCFVGSEFDVVKVVWKGREKQWWHEKGYSWVVPLLRENDPFFFRIVI